MKKLSTLVAMACITVGPLLATNASAQFAKPEDAVKYRQSALTVMSNHFGRIAPVVRGLLFDDTNLNGQAIVIDGGGSI